MGPQQIHQAAMAQNGGLTIIGPNAGPAAGQVMLSFNRNQGNELTAIIAFGGSNQALVTFDAYGTAPVSYSLYNPAPNSFIEQSVQNIVQQLSGYIPQM
jgi:hypothetical protein